MLWIINGSSFLAITVAVDTIPPLLSAGLRFAISGAFLFSVYYFQSELKNHHYHAEINTNAQLRHQERRQQHFQNAQGFAPSSKDLSITVPHREKISIQQWKDRLILGATLFLGGQGLLTWGAQYLSSGMTGLLNSTIPLWIAIIAFLLYKKMKTVQGRRGTDMTRSKIVGLVAGFGGLMLLVAPAIRNHTRSDDVGTAALILSSISWAIGSLYSVRAKLPTSIFASSGMVMITGGMMLIAVSFAFGEHHNLDLFQISRESVIAQIYLIAIITIVGFTDFYWLLRTTSASLANTFAYVSPVIAVLLGGAILHEEITAITVVAMIIILVGVALMVTKTGKKSGAIDSVDKKIPSKAHLLSVIRDKLRRTLAQLSYRIRKR